MIKATIQYKKQNKEIESISFSFEIIESIGLGNALINGESFCNAVDFTIYEDEKKGMLALESYVSQRLYELGYVLI